MKRLLRCAILAFIVLQAKDDLLEGIWQGYDGDSSEVNQNAVINRIRLARGKVASQAMDERPKAAIEVIFNTFQWNVGDASLDHGIEKHWLM